MKLQKRAIIVGQILLVLIVGIGVDKVIQVNTKPISDNVIIPYTSLLETKVELNRNAPLTVVSRGELRSAEEVWANQEEKFMQSEDRYTDRELAQMVIDGQLLEVERTIEVDKYDSNAIDREVKKLKKENKQIEKNTIKATEVINLAYTQKQETINNQQVIQAFPHSSTFKSYMPWTALSKKSAQGKLCAQATPDPNTSILVYEGRYLVALGFAYADHVGEKLDVVMESGQIIPVMIGDFKAKEHTDSNGSSTLHDGSVIEFIVSSTSEAAKSTNRTGSYNGIFPGKIKEFIKIR